MKEKKGCRTCQSSTCILLATVTCGCVFLVESIYIIDRGITLPHFSHVIAVTKDYSKAYLLQQQKVVSGSCCLSNACFLSPSNHDACFTCCHWLSVTFKQIVPSLVSLSLSTQIRLLQPFWPSSGPDIAVSGWRLDDAFLNDNDDGQNKSTN